MRNLRSTRNAFTLVEMLVVVLIITTLSTMGVGVFSGTLDYFRARRSMENLMWDLRKTQQRARSRGHAVPLGATPLESPANFGVAFYAGHARGDGSYDPTGNSYYVYGPSAVVPSNSLPALMTSGSAAYIRENLKELDTALIPVADASTGRNGAAIVPPNDSPAAIKRIQFRVDVQQGGDLPPDLTSGLDVRNFMDFRLQNREGYFRITFERGRFIGLRYVAYDPSVP